MRVDDSGSDGATVLLSLTTIHGRKTIICYHRVVCTRIHNSDHTVHVP